MSDNSYKKSGQNDRKDVQIRAALVPPMFLKRIPGYFLVMSQKKGKLRFIAEHQEANPREFVKYVIDLEEKHRYHMIYTVIHYTDQIVDMFFNELYRECKERMPWVRISPAPYADDINQGINLLAKLNYNDLFEPPPVDSTLYSQLSLHANVEPDETWYAFHALRYILGGLAIHKSIDVTEVMLARKEWHKVQEAVNLTGMSLAAHKLIQEVRRRNQEDLERWNDEFYP